MPVRGAMRCPGVRSRSLLPEFAVIRDFFLWWREQLASLLPASLHGRSVRRALVVAADPAGLAVLHRRGGQERPLGRVPADAAEADLARLLRRRRAVPLLLRTDAALLQRDVTLPLAAEAHVARVLRYEMDRLTPFRSDDVFWDWARLRRDPAQGVLHLRLWLLPRAALAPVLDLLAPLRQAPDLLEAATPDGALRTIRLRQPAPARRAALRAVSGVCAALAVVAVALPFVRQSVRMAEVEHRIAALRAPVAEGTKLRRRALSGGDVLAAEQAALGDAAAALVAVTQALPDDTYLTEFALRRRRLRLGGQSAAAAALIPLLAADRHFGNPVFTAPVTRSDTGHADMFVIETEWAP